MRFFCYFIFCLVAFLANGNLMLVNSMSMHEIRHYREKVKSMFYHAYDSYLHNAFEFDELKPITCEGMNTWGNFQLTTIDALDTLLIFGNYTEFNRITDYITKNLDFNQDINVSVFETNIRVVGGLLSAHLLSYKAKSNLEAGYPCEGPLLRLAEDVAKRLLPAFNTPTGMPYGTVNLKYGVPENETPITCTAGVGTFVIEFGTLSRLTGNDTYEKIAIKALESLHTHRSSLDLVGNHLNTTDGVWVALDSTVGAGVDSYFEYLVKGSFLLHKPELMDMFNVYYKAIQKHMKRDDWHFMVHMNNGLTTQPIFQSLEAFWPGLLTLVGNLDEAKKVLLNYHQVWKQYGFMPEYYDVMNSEVKQNGYPLRPEFIESIFYVYRGTKDPQMLELGAEIVESIDFGAKTDCGYATVKDVKNHLIEDRMESFFIAETMKYLYLLFDDTNFIYNQGENAKQIDLKKGNLISKCIIDSGGYIFNTEAHPMDISMLDCCIDFHSNLENDYDKEDIFFLLKQISINQSYIDASENKNLFDLESNLYANQSTLNKNSFETISDINFESDKLKSKNDVNFELSNLITCNSSDFFLQFCRYGQVLLREGSTN